MITKQLLMHGPSFQCPSRIIIHSLAEYIPITQEVYDHYKKKGKTVGEVGEVVYAPTWLDRLHWSAHTFITPKGDRIICRYPCMGAWHAKGFNNNSIGVEVMVEGTYTYGEFIDRIHTPGWCGERQLQETVNVVREFCNVFTIPITEGKLDGHSTVDPGRKEDPGDGFPWAEFLRRLRHVG